MKKRSGEDSKYADAMSSLMDDPEADEGLDPTEEPEGEAIGGSPAAAVADIRAALDRLEAQIG